MQRYRLFQGALRPHENGEWQKAEDVADEIERLREENERLRSTAGYLRTHIDPAETPPEVRRALIAAVEAYQDEEDG